MHILEDVPRCGGLNGPFLNNYACKRHRTSNESVTHVMQGRPISNISPKALVYMAYYTATSRAS